MNDRENEFLAAFRAMADAQSRAEDAIALLKPICEAMKEWRGAADRLISAFPPEDTLALSNNDPARHRKMSLVRSSKRSLVVSPSPVWAQRILHSNFYTPSTLHVGAECRIPAAKAYGSFTYAGARQRPQKPLMPLWSVGV